MASTTMDTFRIQKEDEGMRLDHFLAQKYKTESRTKIQNSIIQGNIFINGSLINKASYRLKYPSRIRCSIVKSKRDQKNVIPQNLPIKIIYKDKNLIVVNKAAGVPVYPGVGHRKGTLLNALLYQNNNMKKVGANDRFGFIHRIDKETSGIILVALTNQSHFYYSRQFENRSVEKYYITVVKGDIRKRFGHLKTITISNYLGRDKKNRKKQSVISKNKGKFAASVLYFISSSKHDFFGTTSSLIVKPITGRTHQIRVQLSHLGYPIIGDAVYGKGVSYDRMLLHAYMIRVSMLDGSKRDFKADIPKAFDLFFDRKKFYRTMESIIK